MFASSFRVLLMLVVIAVVFLVASSASLPPVVASHFSLGGAPDGFTPRPTYVAFYTALLIFMPLLLPLLLRLLRYAPPSLMNLPNRDYWLAPKQIEATFADLSDRGCWFGGMSLVFFCFVHYLVVEANKVQPHQLAERSLFIGSAFFLLGTIVWAVGLIAHFSRRPAEQSA